MPNVSYCVDLNEVHFNKYTPQPETRIVATFNVTDATNPTTIVGSVYGREGVTYFTNLFSDIEIDGSLLPTPVESVVMASGEHTIKYNLVDNTTLGGNAFANIGNLTSITIPNTVTTIGNSVFSYCTALSSITLPDTITSIGVNAFNRCGNLSSITLPSSITSIGGGSFSYTGLTSMVWPSNVTSISQSAFSHCENLTSITIPNTVTTIGDSSFIDCTGLVSITIPSSVTNINGYAFLRCTGLTSITCEATTPPTLTVNLPFENTNDCPIYVPSTSVSAYQSASGWSTYASRIQAIPTA